MMANIITCIRIVLSIALLFCPALSPVFCALYIAAGFSDLIDGAMARKTGTVSEQGARPETGYSVYTASADEIGKTKNSIRKRKSQRL